MIVNALLALILLVGIGTINIVPLAIGYECWRERQPVGVIISVLIGILVYSTELDVLMGWDKYWVM
jgi:hypothetical protein